ncbi:MAG: NAD-dependent epimerase/dehydratase family protein [bacterium]
MRVLVIGGSRFIGWHTVQRLLDKGHHVTVFHRGNTEARWPGHEVDEILGDMNELADYRQQFVEARPDVVYHNMVIREVDAKLLCEVFDGIAERSVMVSSMDVYRVFGRILGTEPGEPLDGPITEDSPLREQLFPYRGKEPRPADDPRRVMDDYDKIPAEQVVLSHRTLPGCVVRLPMVYGPRDWQRRMFPYLRQMLDDRPYIALDSDALKWRCARGYVENIAHGITLAIENPASAGRLYNLCEPVGTEQQWIERIGRAQGWDGQVLSVPREHWEQHLKCEAHTKHHLDVSSERIRTELGYSEIVDPQTAALRTVEWERDNEPDQYDASLFDYESIDRMLRAPRNAGA